MGKNKDIISWNKKIGNLLLVPQNCAGAERKLALPSDSININHAQLRSLYLYTIQGTFEPPYRWYYLVFSPMNLPYQNDKGWFLFKGLDKVRDKFRLEKTYIITRETSASKVHINLLICSNRNLLTYNGSKCFHKFHIHAQQLGLGYNDRECVLSYITKEFKHRPAIKYLDYIISNPNYKASA